MLTRSPLPTKPDALQLDRVSRTFANGTVVAVDDVSLSVKAGEIVSILGPSGCGKTTTMRMVAGLDRPTSGEIRIHGCDVTRIPTHRRNVGLVFQSLAIFPHMSVRENVAFGLRMRGVRKADIAPKVDRVLSLVQLDPAMFGDRSPRQLSGGQRQRVALARTLVTEPSLILFDEPMASLDRRLRDHMAFELRALQKQLETAAVYVTHDQETASVMSDTIAIMNGGRIVQTGTPQEVYSRPADRFVAGFLGEANFLRGALGADGRTVLVDGLPASRLEACAPPGMQPFVVARPEHLTVSCDPLDKGSLPCRVENVQFVSGFSILKLRLRDGEALTARLSAAPATLPGPGSSAHVGFDAAALHAILE